MIEFNQIPKRYRRPVLGVSDAITNLKARQMVLVNMSDLKSISETVPVRIRGIWHTRFGDFVAIIH